MALQPVESFSHSGKSKAVTNFGPITADVFFMMPSKFLYGKLVMACRSLIGVFIIKSRLGILA